MKSLLKRAPKGGHKVCVEVEPGDGFVVDQGSVSVDPAQLPPGFSGDYGDLTNVPATFTPGVHTHAVADVTGLSADLAAKETPAGAQAKVDAAVSALINGSPAALDTLIELAAALGDDANFATTITNALAGKEPANANIQAHVASAHAPSNAQKNSDITKGEIEAKLTGEISSHSHAGGSGADIKQAEVDFGSVPVWEASFLISDASVSAGSHLVGNVAYVAPTGKDLDEMEMDNLDLKFAPGTGEFTIYARGLDGPIHDKFKINYLCG